MSYRIGYGTPNCELIKKRIRVAVTNAETNHSLNLSTIFRYMLLLAHICSSTRSSAAWAINWFKWRLSSFYKCNNKPNNNCLLELLDRKLKCSKLRMYHHNYCYIFCITNYKQLWFVDDILACTLTN